MSTSTTPPRIEIIRAADPERAAMIETFLEVLDSELWLGNFMRGLCLIVQLRGLATVAQDPAQVRELLDAEVEQLDIDLDYGRKLARIYPTLFQQGGDAA